MKHLLLSITLVIVAVVGACLPAKAQQDTNYWHYHELIYKAECALFDSNNVERCFQYYDQAFNNFEFNYVHDLVNAAQLAHYYQRDYMKYLKKGVCYGLRPMHLRYVTAWKDLSLKKDFLDFFKSEEGQFLRQQYLSTINQEYLAWVYQLSLSELKYRRSKDAQYKQRFEQWDADFLLKIKEFGYPGAKLVGINDSLLYRDLQNEKLNYNRLVQLGADSLCVAPHTRPIPVVTHDGDTIWMRDANPSTDCPDLGYSYLSQNLPMVFLVHHPCPLQIYSAAYNEIAKGNLHPREYVLMLDMAHISDRECDCTQYGNVFYRIGNLSQEQLFKKYFLPEDETDALREQYWIIPLRVERAKADFGAEHGYRFNWGMNNCFK